MTQDQLEQLAELITQKIMDEFDKRIAERYQSATPEDEIKSWLEDNYNIDEDED